MSVFLAPLSVLKALEGMRARFFLGADGMNVVCIGLDEIEL